MPFKKLKLFKSPAIQSKKGQASASPAPKKRKMGLNEYVLENPFFFMLVFVFILAYFLTYLPSKSLPQIEAGEIASADIVSPVDLTIEDTETTEKRRTEAEEAVFPVYLLDNNVFLHTEDKIHRLFMAGREWLKNHRGKGLEDLRKDIQGETGAELSLKDLESLQKAGFSDDLEDTFTRLLGRISEQGVLRSKAHFLYKEPERGFTLWRGSGAEKTTRPEDIPDLKESKELFIAELEKLDLPARNKKLLAGLSDQFLSPNLTFNKPETERRKSLARSRVETVFYTVKKGKVIIRKGDEATAETLKWIRVINQNLQAKPAWVRSFLGTFLLFALIFLTLWHYLKSLLRPREALTNFIMMGMMLVISLFVYKLSVFLATTFSEYSSIGFLTDAEIYRFAFPYQFGTLVFAFLTTNHITLVYAILNSLLAGHLFQANFHQMLFCLIGGLGAIYGIKYYQRQKRSSTFMAGLLVVGPTNSFVILTLYLLREKPANMQGLAGELVMGVVGGALGAVLAFLLLPVFEKIFGLMTSIRILELTNSDLPVFRKMAIDAPGSYHHSLIVASLAEKAADDIKTDPMLVKAGALYHDIGKVKRPEYFIENAIRNPDLHKDLTPRLSTLVIVNHVKEGVELARKLKLPQKIREIIEQHHGNSLVRYFYQKAKEQYDPEMQTIGEESYRYPGPPPQSKEAALIMLADSVEAASRSLSAPTRQNLKRVIIDIFDSYLQDGQLDECGFTLSDLRAVAASFLATLFTIHHPRLKYPEFDFERNRRKKEKTGNHKNNHDRNNKPTE